MTHLDGNVLAGLLADALGFDPTDVAARCRNCGDTGELARTMVYLSDVGAVVRCATCGEVLATVVDAGDRLFLGFSGITAMEIVKRTPAP